MLELKTIYYEIRGQYDWSLKDDEPVWGLQSDSTESLFMQEIQRRGLSQNGKTSAESAEDMLKRAAKQTPDPPPSFAPGTGRVNGDQIAGDQLAKSRALNSEGIEVLNIKLPNS